MNFFSFFFSDVFYCFNFEIAADFSYQNVYLKLYHHFIVSSHMLIWFIFGGYVATLEDCLIDEHDVDRTNVEQRYDGDHVNSLKAYILKDYLMAPTYYYRMPKIYYEYNEMMDQFLERKNYDVEMLEPHIEKTLNFTNNRYEKYRKRKNILFGHKQISKTRLYLPTAKKVFYAQTKDIRTLRDFFILNKGILEYYQNMFDLQTKQVYKKLDIDYIKKLNQNVTTIVPLSLEFNQKSEVSSTINKKKKIIYFCSYDKKLFFNKALGNSQFLNIKQNFFLDTDLIFDKFSNLEYNLIKEKYNINCVDNLSFENLFTQSFIYYFHLYGLYTFDLDYNKSISQEEIYKDFKNHFFMKLFLRIRPFTKPFRKTLGFIPDLTELNIFFFKFSYLTRYRFTRLSNIHPLLYSNFLAKVHMNRYNFIVYEKYESKLKQTSYSQRFLENLIELTHYEASIYSNKFLKKFDLLYKKIIDHFIFDYSIFIISYIIFMGFFVTSLGTFFLNYYDLPMYFEQRNTIGSRGPRSIKRNFGKHWRGLGATKSFYLNQRNNLQTEQFYLNAFSEGNEYEFDSKFDIQKESHKLGYYNSLDKNLNVYYIFVSPEKNLKQKRHYNHGKLRSQFFKRKYYAKKKRVHFFGGDNGIKRKRLKHYKNVFRRQQKKKAYDYFFDNTFYKERPGHHRVHQFGPLGTKFGLRNRRDFKKWFYKTTKPSKQKRKRLKTKKYERLRRVIAKRKKLKHLGRPRNRLKKKTLKRMKKRKKKRGRVRERRKHRIKSRNRRRINKKRIKGSIAGGKYYLFFDGDKFNPGDKRFKNMCPQASSSMLRVFFRRNRNRRERLLAYARTIIRKKRLLFPLHYRDQHFMTKSWVILKNSTNKEYFLENLQKLPKDKIINLKETAETVNDLNLHTDLALTFGQKYNFAKYDLRKYDYVEQTKSFFKANLENNSDNELFFNEDVNDLDEDEEDFLSDLAVGNLLDSERFNLALFDLDLVNSNMVDKIRYRNRPDEEAESWFSEGLDQKYLYIFTYHNRISQIDKFSFKNLEEDNFELRHNNYKYFPYYHRKSFYLLPEVSKNFIRKHLKGIKKRGRRKRKRKKVKKRGKLMKLMLPTFWMNKLLYAPKWVRKGYARKHFYKKRPYKKKAIIAHMAKLRAWKDGYRRAKKRGERLQFFSKFSKKNGYLIKRKISQIHKKLVKKKSKKTDFIIDDDRLAIKQLVVNKFETREKKNENAKNYKDLKYIRSEKITRPYLRKSSYMIDIPYVFKLNDNLKNYSKSKYIKRKELYYFDLLQAAKESTIKKKEFKILHKKYLFYKNLYESQYKDYDSKLLNSEKEPRTWDSTIKSKFFKKKKIVPAIFKLDEKEFSPIDAKEKDFSSRYSIYESKRVYEPKEKYLNRLETYLDIHDRWERWKKSGRLRYKFLTPYKKFFYLRQKRRLKKSIIKKRAREQRKRRRNLKLIRKTKKEEFFENNMLKENYTDSSFGIMKNKLKDFFSFKSKKQKEKDALPESEIPLEPHTKNYYLRYFRNDPQLYYFRDLETYYKARQSKFFKRYRKERLVKRVLKKRLRRLRLEPLKIKKSVRFSSRPSTLIKLNRKFFSSKKTSNRWNKKKKFKKNQKRRNKRARKFTRRTLNNLKLADKYYFWSYTFNNLNWPVSEYPNYFHECYYFNIREIDETQNKLLKSYLAGSDTVRRTPQYMFKANIAKRRATNPILGSLLKVPYIFD